MTLPRGTSISASDVALARKFQMCPPSPDCGAGSIGVPDHFGCRVRRRIVRARLQEEYRALLVFGEAGGQTAPADPAPTIIWSYLFVMLAPCARSWRDVVSCAVGHPGRYSFSHPQFQSRVKEAFRHLRLPHEVDQLLVQLRCHIHVGLYDVGRLLGICDEVVQL